MRLTRYDDENRYYRPCDYESDKQSTILKLCKKLGQLEDIEDELGIDLITLFKILEQDWIYRKEYYPNKIIKCSPRGIEKEGIRILDENEYYMEDTLILEYEEFGKTWALTKEELL